LSREETHLGGSTYYTFVRHEDGTSDAFTYDLDGHVTRATTTQSDGSKEVKDFLIASKPYDSDDKFYDDHGALTSLTEFHGSNKYYEEAISGGTTTTDNYDSGGHLIRETITQSDGSKEVKDFLIASKPYDSDDKFYDDHGALTSLTEFQGADKYYSKTISAGTTTTDNYDSGGNLDQETIVHPDGSRDVSKFGIVNPLYHASHASYDASQTQLEADYANNDNTRSLSVKAAGVVVESTSGTDIFTSFGNDDTFVFHAHSGNDTISHFKAGSAAGHDMIEIDAEAAASGLSYTSINNGHDTLITIDADDSITVKNAHVDDVKQDVSLLLVVHL
jgi:trimeric autotransporter adhesin